MNEALSKAEAAITELRTGRHSLTDVSLCLDLLAREIQRSQQQDDEDRPGALAVQIGLAGRVADNLAEAKRFLTQLTQRLDVLQHAQRVAIQGQQGMEGKKETEDV